MKFLALGEFATNIVKAMLLLCFSKYLYDQTGQILAIAVTFIAEMVMMVLIPAVAGSYIDKNGARSGLLISAVAHVVICAIGTVVILVLGDRASLILLLSIGLSAVWPISRIAVFTLTPELSAAERLEKDNGWLMFSLQSGQLLGMVLAGVLLVYQSLEVILYAANLLLLLALVCYVGSVKNHKVLRAQGTDVYSDMSLREVVRLSKRFFPVFLVSNFDFSSVAVFNILLAAVVVSHYDGNTYWLAGLDAAFAIGAIAGGLLIARMWRTVGTTILDPVMTQVVFLLYLFALGTTALKFYIPLVVIVFGLFQSYSGIFWRTELQRSFPTLAMGRLTAARTTVSSMYIGLSAMLIAFFHEISMDTALVSAAVMVVIQIGALVLYHTKAHSLHKLPNS